MHNETCIKDVRPGYSIAGPSSILFSHSVWGVFDGYSGETFRERDLLVEILRTFGKEYCFDGRVADKCVLIFLLEMETIIIYFNETKIQLINDTNYYYLYRCSFACHPWNEAVTRVTMGGLTGKRVKTESRKVS